MSGIATRLATVADLSACAAVHIESCLDIYRPFVSAEVHASSLPANLKAVWAAEGLEGGDFIMLAEEDGKVLGIVAVRNREPAYVDNFHVLPSFKRRGIGRMLMRAAVDEMLKQGKIDCYLDFALGNDGAKQFYIALGGELGEEVEGDLFGHPLPAQIVRFPDLAAILI
jgi:ribosomal protein S18 acetylase RimI-like enzyme